MRQLPDALQAVPPASGGRRPPLRGRADLLRRPLDRCALARGAMPPAMGAALRFRCVAARCAPAALTLAPAQPGRRRSCVARRLPCRGFAARPLASRAAPAPLCSRSCRRTRRTLPRAPRSRCCASASRCARAQTATGAPRPRLRGVTSLLHLAARCGRRSASPPRIATRCAAPSRVATRRRAKLRTPTPCFDDFAPFPPLRRPFAASSWSLSRQSCPSKRVSSSSCAPSSSSPPRSRAGCAPPARGRHRFSADLTTLALCSSSSSAWRAPAARERRSCRAASTSSRRWRFSPSVRRPEAMQVAHPPLACARPGLASSLSHHAPLFQTRI